MSKNIEMLTVVANGLGEIKNEVVFIGGSVAELYADDPASSDIRATLDIDCVVEISSRIRYNELEERLRAKGFYNDMTQGAPICRWVYKGVIVDVMPMDENVLGFTNQWYKGGIEHKTISVLPENTEIFVFPTPYYLGTKFEAVLSRGGGDLRISHDFEDIIYILDNVTNIVEQISNTEDPIRQYLAIQFADLLRNPNIEEAIACALPYGAEERVNYIIDILRYDYLRL